VIEMDYAEQKKWEREQAYKKYYRQRRNRGCVPLTYRQWVDWKERERQQRMKS